MALQFNDPVNELGQSEYITDAPARHGVGFRKRSGNDDVAFEIRVRGNGKRLSSIIKKMRVAFVGEEIDITRSEEHTSELQSHVNLVCRLLLEKKKKNKI